MSIYPSLLVRDSVRYWKRKPWQALLCVMLLALGSASVAILWTVTDTIVLKPLPFPDSHELYGFQSVDKKKGETLNVMSLADFRDIREAQTSFSGVFGYRGDFLNYKEESGTTRQIFAARVTRDFVDVLKVTPEIGRFFESDEFATEEGGVAVISYSLWKSQFGGDYSAIGTTFWADDQVYQIIGVMPKNYNEPQFTDIWTPFPDVTGEYFVRDSRYWNMVGRLKPGVSLNEAQIEIAQIADSLAAQYPDTNRNRGARLETMQKMIVGDYSTPILLIFIAVSLVMFATCLNLANLQLISGLQRRSEVGIRQSIGESHHQAFSRVLMEALAVCLVGCALGGLIGWYFLENLEDYLPDAFLPRIHEIGLSASLVWSLLAIALVASVGFGLLPAIQAARTNTNEILKAGESRHGLSVEGRRSRNWLLALQISVAVVILNAALLVVNEYKRLESLDLGFREENLTMITVSPGQSRFLDFPALSLYYQEIADWVAAQPGVSSATTTSSPPLWGFSLDTTFKLQGRDLAAERDESITAVYNSVSNDYLSSMGIKVIGGRDFSQWDNRESQRVALVNQAFVDEYLSGVDPMGEYVQIQPWMDPSFRQIVGVVKDFSQKNLTDDPEPQVIVPMSQSPWIFTTVMARTSIDTLEGLSDLEVRMKAAFPDLGITLTSMDELLDRQLGIQELMYLLFLCFGVATLLLSLFGIGSQMAFNVSERGREWGIRLALGATIGQLNSLVLKKLISPLSGGIVVGLVVFTLSIRFQPDFGNALDPRFLLFSSGTILAIVAASFLTTWVVSNRMTRSNPQDVLKSV